MAFKLTMFFSLSRRAWTESYLNSGTWPSSAANTAVNDLIAKRAACLGAGASIFAARISQFPANKIVQNILLGSFPTTGALGATTEPAGYDTADQANAVVIFKSTTAVGIKLTYLAGLPDGVIDSTTSGIPGYSPNRVGGFVDAIRAFGFSLTSNNWGCRTWKTTVLSQATGLVEGTQTPPMIGVVLPSVVTWVPGQKVLLGGWRRSNPRAAGLSGLFTIGQVVVAPPPATQSTIYLLNTSQVSPSNFKTIGSIGLALFTVTPLEDFGADRAGTRKRGGRVLLPLGKSSRVH